MANPIQYISMSQGEDVFVDDVRIGTIVSGPGFVFFKTLSGLGELFQDSATCKARLEIAVARYRQDQEEQFLTCQGPSTRILEFTVRAVGGER